MKRSAVSAPSSSAHAIDVLPSLRQPAAVTDTDVPSPGPAVAQSSSMVVPGSADTPYSNGLVWDAAAGVPAVGVYRSAEPLVSVSLPPAG